MTMIKAETINTGNHYNPATVYKAKKRNEGNSILLMLSELLCELKKTEYDKSKILELYNILRPYIKVNEDKNKLFSRSGYSVTGVKADGVNEWRGSILLKWHKLTYNSKFNTTWVGRQLATNILCLIEVEDKDTIKSFQSDQMYDKSDDFKKDVDYKGIDIDLLSNYPLKNIKKHYINNNIEKIPCNRDCVEVELELTDNRSLFILLNRMPKKDRDVAKQGNILGKSPTDTLHQIILKNYNLLNGQSLLMV